MKKQMLTIFVTFNILVFVNKVCYGNTYQINVTNANI